MDEAVELPAVPQACSVIESHEIQHYLPHRYPFLFVDRIIALEKYTRAIGLKCHAE
jgi:3-hydroxymyristoyl/3-hydroxydecanoyl-(acyl carrier protein) dehydratase